MRSAAAAEALCFVSTHATRHDLDTGGAISMDIVDGREEPGRDAVTLFGSVGVLGPSAPQCGCVRR